MSLPSNLQQILSSLLAVIVVIAPAPAHEIKTSAAGDVAATFHLEPGHQPKAGKSSRAWFALTRRGGQIIPLAQCACRLAVYAIPRGAGKAKSIVQPNLKAINVEKYQGIPAANITFPQAGRYELQLVGKANSGANFQPFKFSYEVTVGN